MLYSQRRSKWTEPFGSFASQQEVLGTAAAAGGSHRKRHPHNTKSATHGHLHPTSLDGSFDLNNLTLNQPAYRDDSDQVSRANSVRNDERSTGSRSNRASLGMVNTLEYGPIEYAHSTGQVTPDSIITSGATTLYIYQQSYT